MKSNYTKPKWALYQNGAIVHKQRRYEDLQQAVDNHITDALRYGSAVFNPFSGEVELQSHGLRQQISNSNYFIASEYGPVPSRYSYTDAVEGRIIVPYGYRLVELPDCAGYQLFLDTPTTVREPTARPGLFTRLRNLFT